MSINSKLIALIILFTFLIGCKAESPKSKSSDDSSSTSTDSGTGTTSYVGKWVKSSNNSMAIDWKSDSFIYGCIVGTYTYARHGSYSSSNSRITWWGGTYNTVSSSGSNILLGSSTYNPAVLTAACNPFWTYYTSENTQYTNAARSIGSWKFTYTIISTYNDYPLMSDISTRRTSDNNYYNYGEDETGDIITGTYTTSTGKYDILMTGSIIDVYHVFSITSSNSSSSGCYYQYSHSSSSWSSCYSATGAKLYGIPRTYRTNIEQTSDEMMEKRRQEQIIDESMRSNRRLTDEDQKAFKRYKQLLQILNSSDKEPLRKYLRSFRNN
jgi:hypothetical protein